jgi:CRISPR-associated protein Cas1
VKQHLNTLFITTEGAYLAKDGQAVAVRIDGKVQLRVPLHNLGGVVCFGRVTASPAAMAACAEAGVTISLLDAHGRFRAAVVGFSQGNVLLRRAQYRAADDPDRSCAIARQLVAAKVANARSVLLRGARDANSESVAKNLTTAATRLVFSLQAARGCASLDALRGIEGEAANAYFAAFAELIGVDGFCFDGRSRRPPLDPMNALLSLLYSMLAHDARSACEAAGLDAAVGFLHRDRPGRPGLALDLMEEFRPLLADRLALSLVNRKQIGPYDFQTTATGAVLMNDKARKAVLVAYQKRKQETLTHPYLGEKTTVGLLVHLQARLLARLLRGDLDVYPPFLWR